MNILIDEIDQVVKSKIKEDFNTDFRVSILFELLMQDNSLSDKVKLNQAINLYYQNVSQIEDIEKAINNILWFYGCGKEEVNVDENKKENTKNNKQIYSYEFDDELIYSAFRDQYGIDLQEIEYLHWWKFKTLFNGLKKDNLIVEIMGYRAIDISKIKDKDEKKYYKKLQKLYALPDMRTTQQKEADFGKAFW